MQNIETIKKELQNTTHKHIMGIKFVTTETPKQVLRSIENDAKLYNKNISDFIIRDTNKLLIRLEGNAIPCAYYFENIEVMTVVIKELKKGGMHIR